MSLPVHGSRVPSFIFIGLLLLLTKNMRLVSATPILLYEDAHFKGKSSRFQIGESICINLVGKLNDFYSSVDTLETCLHLCEHRNCGGKCSLVRGKLEDLSDINLNDKVSSIRGCAPEISTSSSSTTERRRDKNDRDGKSMTLTPAPITRTSSSPSSPSPSSTTTTPRPTRRTTKMKTRKPVVPPSPTTAGKPEVAANPNPHHQTISRDEQESLPPTQLPPTKESRTETTTSYRSAHPSSRSMERRNITSEHSKSSNDDGSSGRSSISNDNKNMISYNTPLPVDAENPSLERIQRSSYRHRRKRRRLILTPTTITTPHPEEERRQF